MHDKYFLWGAGSVGTRALSYLVNLNCIIGVIDSDSNKWGKSINGLKIYNYEEIKTSLNNIGIIIAYFGSKETEELLSKDGRSFIKLSEFITEYYWEKLNQSAIGFLDFPVTTNCTLMCKYCMQYIPYRIKEDVSLDALKNELKILLNKVAFIGEISIIGGEPFLYKQLSDLLLFIKDNYYNQIGSFVITTNGTIIPEKKVLDLCKTINAYISISDYSEILPELDSKITKLEAAARQIGISIERKRWFWVDPGRFDKTNDVVDCTLTHMQLSKQRLWKCSLMAAGYHANYCNAVEGQDYYDLVNNDSITIRDLMVYKGIERTSQCKKCLYPTAMAIPSAEQC